jgi:hypothetical protein
VGVVGVVHSTQGLTQPVVWAVAARVARIIREHMEPVVSVVVEVAADLVVAQVIAEETAAPA